MIQGFKHSLPSVGFVRSEFLLQILQCTLNTCFERIGQAQILMIMYKYFFISKDWKRAALNQEDGYSVYVFKTKCFCY